MNARLKRIFAAMLITAVILPSAAISHQSQVALSTVTLKPLTGSIEVIHRFYLHDAEQAQSDLSGRQVDMMFDDMVQQQFGDYVSENFKLMDQAKNSIALAFVGTELDGDFIWVYQEAQIPAGLTDLVVINSTLLDVFPAQVNTVNVECGKALSTLSFTSDIRAAQAGIDFSQCLD